MKHRVLISCPYFIPVVEDYRSRLENAGCELVVPTVTERLDEDELLSLVAEIDATLCGDDAYTRRVIDAAPRLRVIAKWGTGTDSIDKVAARERGIVVCNTPGAFTEPVADSVLGYALSFARRLPFMDRAMKASEWKKIPGRSLGESTLGIIGVGSIGKAVARRAKAFGTRVLGTDLIESDPEWTSIGIDRGGLDELVGASDGVSLYCDLRPQNVHLISTPQFKLMKPHAILINTARGPLIDEMALSDALFRGEIGGAALDVFEREPLPHNSPMLEWDTVMLAPHNSNSSPRAWARVHESTVSQLLQHLVNES
jgi:D-3-phosphoglycerate dehydrogenase